MYFTSIATFFIPSRNLSFIFLHYSFITLSVRSTSMIKVYILCTEKALQVMFVFENQALIYLYIFLQVCLFSDPLFSWIDLKTLNQVYTTLKFLKLGKYSTYVVDGMSSSQWTGKFDC